MTIRANFSNTGLNVGEHSTNLTYLYGLSDFFSVMFQDTSVVNLLLEADSETASEIYSNFLQLTSSISLAKIQATMHSTIKLVLLHSDAAVDGKVNTYHLPESFQSTRYIANRPLLPTGLLQEGVDYRIEQQKDGSSIIRFAAPIESYPFSSRVVSEGVKIQYALWFVDCEIDEQMLSTFYGNLIGVGPENASERFANFLYGLYYVYVNGPELDMLNKGLNLCLGIPMARTREVVLDVRTYLDTDQYFVICDQNQYVIPYGLPPTVKAGQIIEQGTSLANWVEVKDWQHDGEWWVNMLIPERIIPAMPDGQINRHATPGSHFDYIMRNYLKKHTFMVKINVGSFKNDQQFLEISKIINRAKPTYTEAIYVWSVEKLEDTIHINDDDLKYSMQFSWCEHIKACISRFYRNNEEDAVLRKCPRFIRYNIDYKYLNALGGDSYINDNKFMFGSPYSAEPGSFEAFGFVNTMSQFRANTPEERAWIRAKAIRGEDSWRGDRSKFGFYRGVMDETSNDGVPAFTTNSAWDVPIGMRVVPLYTTTMHDIMHKVEDYDQVPPQDDDWHFTLFDPARFSMAINQQAINERLLTYNPQDIISAYDSVFFRPDWVGYFGNEFPIHSWTTWAPEKTDVMQGDYLLCVRIIPSVVGVYWVTTNQTVKAPAYFPVGELDPLVATYDMPLTRNGGYNGSPFYVMRGRGSMNYNNESDAINETPINEMAGTPTSVVPYSDKYNPSPLVIRRDGMVIRHAMESL